jgi:hypothetical protein
MLLPIRCYGCKIVVREFNAATGHVYLPELPGIRVQNCVFDCICGRIVRFDGKKARNKVRELIRPVVITKVIIAQAA